MSRVARVTEDLGRGDGGFYIEAPDIPDGMTCRQWRASRQEDGPAERTHRSLRVDTPRLRLRQPALRLRTA